MRRAVVKACGMSVPNQVMTNHDLEKLVDTSHDWIVQRTGIHERRVSRPDEFASTFAGDVARQLLRKSGLDAQDVDLIVVGTVTGDMPFPSTACYVQEMIGAWNAGAYDLGAACAGFIYAMASAGSQVESGHIRNALVIGVDVLSKFVDWTDRSTCVLFGDGAGGVLLQGEDNTDRGLERTVLLSDGRGAHHINFEMGGSRYPVNTPHAEGRRHHIFMNGAETYRFAVHAMGDACCRVLDEVGLTPDDIDLFVPHQANLRIIDAARERLGLPAEKVFVNVNRYGNTSAGSIPIGLCEAEAAGRLKPGMRVLTVGFGAGLVWGANIIKW
ncbi:MAG: ketoacyl-ACP synthase III [Fimbriimonadaceae bacterium]|nr:ketoacyl-ACP synthase III [Fimbriimonadaceae bacterium]